MNSLPSLCISWHEILEFLLRIFPLTVDLFALLNPVVYGLLLFHDVQLHILDELLDLLTPLLRFKVEFLV